MSQRWHHLVHREIGFSSGITPALEQKKRADCRPNNHSWFLRGRSAKRRALISMVKNVTLAGEGSTRLCSVLFDAIASSTGAPSSFFSKLLISTLHHLPYVFVKIRDVK